MPVDYVLDLIVDTENQERSSRELIEHFVEDASLEQNQHVFALLCEIFAASHAILQLLEREIETAVLSDESKEMMFLQSSLEVLQQLVVAKFYANKELEKTKYSTALH